MLKIAMYSLTRDRLEYTKKCFEILWGKAGIEFDHYIIDNGSDDGTQDWLHANSHHFKQIVFNDKNYGISIASNQALASIFTNHSYDYVVKFDNDCEIVTPNCLKLAIDAMEEVKILKHKFVASPIVNGIHNQPKQVGNVKTTNFTFWRVGIIGGLFHIVPGLLYSKWKYPTNLPKAWGQDDRFCEWAFKNGYRFGYIEELVVNHYETTGGQAKRFPEYFIRKRKEEII